MERSDDLLEGLGIEVLAKEGTAVGDEGLGHVECLRVAQRLRRLGLRSIGLFPASAEVGVVGVAVNLAAAIAEIAGAPVAFIDASLRWPALAGVLEGEARPEDGSSARGPFRARWVRDQVALLIPSRQEARSASLGVLKDALAAQPAFDCCLVDLTGWERLGEHLQAFALLDGVIVVATTGVSTEADILRAQDEVPAVRNLGTLLLGAPVVGARTRRRG
jgi:Mrp family chromosome partitioning ATPase